jgi:hypothetical protein
MPWQTVTGWWSAGFASFSENQKLELHGMLLGSKAGFRTRGHSVRRINFCMMYFHENFQFNCVIIPGELFISESNCSMLKTGNATIQGSLKLDKQDESD